MLWGNSTMNSSSGCILKTRHYHGQITEGWRNACGLKTGIAIKNEEDRIRTKKEWKKYSMRRGQDEDRTGWGQDRMRTEQDEDRTGWGQDRMRSRTKRGPGKEEVKYKWGTGQQEAKTGTGQGQDKYQNKRRTRTG
jgi:hypothetical protein